MITESQILHLKCQMFKGCPAPMVAAINPSTGQALACTGGVACPAGFACQQANNGQMTCCGTGTATPPGPTARCPFAGQQPYIVPGSGQVQTCRVGLQTCPTNYQCLNGGGGFICCSAGGRPVTPGTQLTGACPLGSSVYINPITQQAQMCANSFVRCPATHTCRYSNALRNYYCCSNVNTGVMGAGSLVMLTIFCRFAFFGNIVILLTGLLAGLVELEAGILYMHAFTDYRQFIKN